MKRWGLLVIANVLATVVLFAMSTAFDPAPWWLLAPLMCLGFPMALLVLVIRSVPIMLVLLLLLNPLLWAGFVEGILRRFVDRPKDSDVD